MLWIVTGPATTQSSHQLKASMPSTSIIWTPLTTSNQNQRSIPHWPHSNHSTWQAPGDAVVVFANLNGAIISMTATICWDATLTSPTTCILLQFKIWLDTIDMIGYGPLLILPLYMHPGAWSRAVQETTKHLGNNWWTLLSYHATWGGALVDFFWQERNGTSSSSPTVHN